MGSGRRLVWIRLQSLPHEEVLLKTQCHLAIIVPIRPMPKSRATWRLFQLSPGPSPHILRICTPGRCAWPMLRSRQDVPHLRGPLREWRIIWSGRKWTRDLAPRSVSRSPRTSLEARALQQSKEIPGFVVPAREELALVWGVATGPPWAQGLQWEMA